MADNQSLGYQGNNISSRGMLLKGRTPPVPKGKLEVVMEYRVALSTRKCVAKTLSAPLLNAE